MSWFKKKKEPTPEELDQSRAEFRRALKYGDDYRDEWKLVNETIAENEKRKAQLKQKLAELGGHPGPIAYPEYMSILDTIYVRQCKDSPIGYCCVMCSCGDGIMLRDKICMFCKKQVS